MSVFSYNNSDAENASGDIKNVISEIEGTLTDMDGDMNKQNTSRFTANGRPRPRTCGASWNRSGERWTKTPPTFPKCAAGPPTPSAASNEHR